jgi:hypothetical protein
MQALSLRRALCASLFAVASLMVACGEEDAGGGGGTSIVVVSDTGATSGADLSDTSGASDVESDTSGGTSGTDSDTSGGTSGTDSDTSGGTSGTDSDTSGGTSGTDSDTSGGTSGTDSDTSGGTSGTDSDTSGGTSGTDSDTSGTSGTDGDTSGSTSGDTSGSTSGDTSGAADPCPAGCPQGQACDGGVCRAVSDIPTPTVSGEVIFTELMPNPRRSDSNGEWVEVYNAGDATFNLRGCVVIQSGSGQFTINSTTNGMVVQPGQHATMGGAGDSALGFDATFNYSSSQFLLADANKTLTLRCGAVDIDVVSYTTTTTGYTLSLDPSAYDAASNDDAASWCDTPAGTYSTAPAEEHGTPNALNPDCP